MKTRNEAMKSTQYLSRDDNMNQLVSQMPELERARYLRFGNQAIQSVFVGRKFVAYKVTRTGCEVLELFVVEDFNCDARCGARAGVRKLANGDRLVITHVPVKLFELPVFLSIPTDLGLRWDARDVNGVMKRSLSFAFLIKTKNHPRFCSLGNVYLATPNEFRDRFPEAAAI